MEMKHYDAEFVHEKNKAWKKRQRNTLAFYTFYELEIIEDAVYYKKVCIDNSRNYQKVYYIQQNH